MFTGIVEETGIVEFCRPVENRSEGDGASGIHNYRLRIKASRVLGDLAVADSICVNGACLTVVARDESGFEMDVVPETLRRTNLGTLVEGSMVNLERSLSVNGRLGGHVVQGHVDGVGVVEEIRAEGGALIFRIGAPQELMRYIVEKGFIGLDGISLTVVDVLNSAFTISVIPYTLENTNLQVRETGESVNLEVDILAKYVESLLPHKATGDAGVLD